MTGESTQPRRRWSVAVIRLTIVLMLTVALGTWAYDWIQIALVQVHETDARISVDMVTVSSRVDGRLDARPVDAGSRVTRGEVIARVDDREAQAWVREIESERARLLAQRDEIGARIHVVEVRVTSRVAAEKAGLRSAAALVGALRAEFDYAERDLKRAEMLSEQGVVSAKTLDVARTEYLTKQKELVRAQAAVASATARIDEVKAEREEIQVFERERVTLDRRAAELETRIDRARLDVDDRIIVSPLDGVVSRAFVEAGEYVKAGQRIVLIHDPGAVYVEANIRETDIRRVVLGQSVHIKIDAYPDREFSGRVERIGDAATSQFSLLPNPNPSGQFTKVTQRLPVRIAIDPGTDPSSEPFRPGMMVEVFIDVGRD